ncbi:MULTISPECIES: hypothetical protein [Vibrio]|uniref:hypothetical protein n=1 Tax=Vibrio TaxID=662 RepID=UPI00165D87EF|nr:MULTISPECIES: hypothetical protein [Vibrio]EGR7969130.1 hypothetical protein [Vibrio vulnificus]USD53565.1 hypothetical protein J4N44_09520 [Vibrio sp. SCSIO 43155]HEQ3591005.1 hypothetical protein [Vibrio harveyi]HEQ3599555.1 hypothetical protein [Vibrio harveyi]HEQ3611589.1 hypothetical protein [Vibrio harveyi]
MEESKLNELMEIEAAELSKIFVGEVEPLVQVLKAHLYTENFLEKYILVSLPRGDKLIENGNLSYHHKLLICEASEAIPDDLVSSLRNLNKIRNKFAHQLDMEISETDVLRVGSPLGSSFTKLKKDNVGNHQRLFSSLLVSICTRLSVLYYVLEHNK